ncbi:HPF/RaiA family ribosome-associated protein, partial [Filifactor alocis]
MNLKMIGKNISITKAMEEVLTEKLSKLDKFFDTDVEARVAVSA